MHNFYFFFRETTLVIYTMAVVGMLAYTFALDYQHLVLLYATSAFLGSDFTFFKF